MANKILVKRSTVAGTAPAAGSLLEGELAANLADQQLYSKLGTTVIPLGVRGSAPYFSAYQNAAQTLASATFTKIQCQVVEVNNRARYNGTAAAVNGIPPWAFMPDVPGEYLVNGCISVASTATSIFSYAYKNGVLEKGIGGLGGANGGAQGSALVYLNGTTDYLEFYSYFGVGQNSNPGIGFTFWQAIYQRP